MSDVFQTQAQIQSIRTLVDGGNKLDVVTQELSPQDLTKLFGLKSKLVWFVAKENEITQADIPQEEITLEDTYKKPSQRLRNVLYRVWEQTTDQSEPFQTHYYPRIMEQLIEKYKEKLV